MTASTEPADATIRLRRGGMRIECVAALRELRVEDYPWEDARRLAAATQVVKHSAARSVVRIPAPDDAAAPPLYIKRYRFTELRRRLKSALGLSRARNEWRACREVRALGVGAPRPLLVADHRIGALAYESYLVTEAVERGTDAARLLARLTGADADDALRRLGRVVAQLHQRGIYHDDLKAAHIVLTTGGIPQTGLDGVVLLDLYRCDTGRRPSLRRRGVNLAQVLISLPATGERECALLMAGFREITGTTPLGTRLLEHAVAVAVKARRRRRAHA